MHRLTIAVVTLGLVVGSAGGVSGQQEHASPSAAASAAPESATAAPSWLDEQTCVDPDFMWPASAGGGSTGELLDCAKSLGLRKGDPDYDTYDFTLMKRTESHEQWTQQCNEADTHIGTRYHAWGTDTLYRNDKPKRTLSGTFDFTVVSTLIDPGTDTWQVEKQGVIWDVRSPDGDLAWTWSVEITRDSDGVSDEPDPDEYPPQLDTYRGVGKDTFGVFCEYLK